MTRPLFSRTARARPESAPDPSAVLADATALLHAGLDPDRAWRVLGVPVDAEGIPIASEPPLSAHPPSADAVRAACLLARDTGAPLVSVLGAIDGALAVVRSAQDAAEAALAGPRMSARILRWLPLIGAGLAAAVDPAALRLLATSPAGWGLLAVAAAMTWAGSGWMARMVARASIGGPSPGKRGGGAVPPAVVLALVEAALGAGLPVATACERVAVVVDPASSTALLALAAGRPAHASHPLTHALAGPLALAAQAGAPARFGLRAAMTRLDREQRRDIQRAAGELGVRLTLPLALCLLPAFVLVGVVPLLIAVVAGAGIGDLGLLTGTELP
ncbi:type II secretion system F family protein [Demequina sp.]|uniref:type II secretion system F family protein n=1 Tax=Demequina sp. TaxID=2050685 RepID=UPI003A85B0FD